MNANKQEDTGFYGRRRMTLYCTWEMGKMGILEEGGGDETRYFQK